MNFGLRCLLGIGLAATLSCAKTKPSGADGQAGTATTGKPARPAVPVVTPDTALRGKVMSVNTRTRYVVLNFPVGRMADAGQVLNVYRNGLKVGEVKVDTWRRDDNVVADIIAGEAQPGDDVRDR